MAAVANGQEQLANGSTELQSENPFVRELQKNIRNIRKRLTTTQKADAIIAENPTASLDELLKAKKINADQKLQLERKPLLRTQLQQMEDQLEHYKKFDEESSKRFAKERIELEEAHQQAIKQAREEALASAAPQTGSSDARSKLLLLSRFLRAAASRRQQTDDNSAEGKAFEGALLLVYGGNEKAVDTIEKIIAGSDEIVPTTDGEPSGASYTIFQEYISADSDVPEPVEESPVQATSNGSDPTIVHAGLTEIDAATDAPFSNADLPTTTNAPEIGSTQSDAANSAALAQELSSSTISGPEGWVEVPRDANETDTGLTATIGAPNGTQSWADDVPAAAASTQTPANDGFHEVHHHNNSRGGRGRGEGHRGRGGFRGRQLEGGYRGRGGFRGDRGEGGRGGRGRGRGGEYRGRGRGGADSAAAPS